ncbi:MAG: ATP-binding protein [Clostridiales bacterium]|nr:ATP-binding protein [Clostridiales bacterium]
MGADARPIALYGLRGVGKTVLLRDLYNRSKRRGWIAAYIESNPDKDLRALLCEELEDVLADLAKPGAGETILKAVKTALSFIRFDVNADGGLSFGVDLTRISGSNAATGNTSGDLGRVIRDLSAACEKTGTGIALFFDEAQDFAAEDLRAINTLSHRASQECYRLVVTVAGLPTLPGRLANINSYAERLYQFGELGELDSEAARTALLEPSAAKGVQWEESAISAVVQATAGFAYFIQEYGYAAWDTAEASPITGSDAEAAKETATLQLDRGFFRSRWDRASDVQKAYMRAMAVDGDRPSQTAEIAARLGVEKNAVSPRRAELIAKGLIYSPLHGTVAFTVPQMAAFINRQAGEE